MAIELTADQWFEVEMAVLWGTSQAVEEGMSAERRAREHEARQARFQRILSEDENLSKEERDEILAELTLSRDEKERLMREQHYSQPPAKRARQAALLRTNAYNSLTASEYFSQAQRDAIDETLAGRSLPSLRQLEIASKQYPKRVLRRGRIASEEEWRMVQDILEFTSPIFDVTDSDRLALEDISAEYERSIRQGP